METRLFWIGVAMGAYAWLSRRWKANGAVDTPVKCGLWHGLFLGMAASSVALVLAMSMEGRGPQGSGRLSALWASQFYPAALAGVVFGAVGFWRGYASGDKTAARGHYLEEDWEWSETVFSAVILASVLMYFVIQAFKIPSGSMRRTFMEGDHLFVNKFIYGLRVPFSGRRVLSLRKVARGDIVVFRFPSEDPRKAHCNSIQHGKDFIKRVVGLPGDKVEVVNGVLKVNGRFPVEPFVNMDPAERDPYRQPKAMGADALGPERYQELWRNHDLDRALEGVVKDQFGPVTVPEGAYMMMGDNRDHSCDSRYWGPVETKYLKGKAWFIYWPPSRMGALR
ncbi:MAG: signal peptidase I [Elusimicrobia bacterium]|nr:signal peptidase I [Elusimicrobiota bacterium]